jgi:hypothetical protein
MRRTSARAAGSSGAAARARRVTAEIRARLEQLEASDLDPRSGELLVMLCWLVQEDVEALRAEPELAWRSFALALLADEIADQ